MKEDDNEKDINNLMVIDEDIDFSEHLEFRRWLILGVFALIQYYICYFLIFLELQMEELGRLMLELLIKQKNTMKIIIYQVYYGWLMFFY